MTTPISKLRAEADGALDHLNSRFSAVPVESTSTLIIEMVGLVVQVETYAESLVGLEQELLEIPSSRPLAELIAVMKEVQEVMTVLIQSIRSEIDKRVPVC